MATLPTDGGDNGVWAGELNEFLQVAHNADGTLKTGADPDLTAHITDTSAAHAAAAISVNSTTLVGTGTDAQAVFEELDNGIADHLADATDAHDASAISILDTAADFTATNVEDALAELQTAIEGISVGASLDRIDFEAEYGAVRAFVTGNETANETAFANLGTDIRAYTTRNQCRKIWFGPSNGKYYWGNSNIPLSDFEDVIFEFDWGPEFSGPIASYSPIGGGFMWSGAEDVAMFSVIASTSTIQRGLQWRGSWTCATNTDGFGYGIFVDGVNNWGGPASVVSLTSQANAKCLKRGLMTDNLINGDNAHGVIGAMYSGGCDQGSVYAKGGGFSIYGGNISSNAGQKGSYIGPLGSEMKYYPGLKHDGSGTILIDCQGSYCEFLGQVEIYNGNTGLIIDRTTNTGGSDNSGRFNRLGGNFVGNDGTGRAWIVKNTAGGLMYGNKLDQPGYSNVLDQSKTQDATVLPSGEDVFHQGMDYYRLIISGAYV